MTIDSNRPDSTERPNATAIVVFRTIERDRNRLKPDFEYIVFANLEGARMALILFTYRAAICVVVLDTGIDSKAVSYA